MNFIKGNKYKIFSKFKDNSFTGIFQEYSIEKGVIYAIFSLNKNLYKISIKDLMNQLYEIRMV